MQDGAANHKRKDPGTILCHIFETGGALPRRGRPPELLRAPKDFAEETSTPSSAGQSTPRFTPTPRSREPAGHFPGLPAFSRRPQTSATKSFFQHEGATRVPTRRIDAPMINSQPVRTINHAMPVGAHRSLQWSIRRPKNSVTSQVRRFSREAAATLTQVMAARTMNQNPISGHRPTGTGILPIANITLRTP